LLGRRVRWRVVRGGDERWGGARVRTWRVRRWRDDGLDRRA
jgi:hypothetical protein